MAQPVTKARVLVQLHDEYPVSNCASYEKIAAVAPAQSEKYALSHPTSTLVTPAAAVGSRVEAEPLGDDAGRSDINMRFATPGWAVG